MANIIGATTSVIQNTASVVSGAVASVTNLTSAFSSPLGAQLPAPNVLSNYASYNYIIGLSALTINDLNYPDVSYKSGKVLPLICKTGGIDPNNRIQTKYGKYDFFIDNLNFESVIGLETSKSTNTTTIQFDVFEPYSIGVFMLALQTAAYDAGFKNWRDAPFLLSIEFRGARETGVMSKVPFTTRHIPIKLTTVQMRANEQGCRYMVNSYATNSQALTTQYANLKTDVSIKGKTVQEVLQTGEYSLQAVVNQHLKEYKSKGTVAVPDEVVIIFPNEKDIPSSSSSNLAPGGATTPATTTPTSSASDINKKLGVVQSPINKTLVQPDGEVNEIGSAKMGYSYSRKGDTSTANEQVIVDEKTGKWQRGKLKVDPTEGTLKFSQDMDILTVINQVLLTSAYPETALKTGKVDNDGMRTWWRIDTQVYFINSEENLKKTGSYPKLIVYRIVPYKAHSSKVTAPNEAAPGFSSIKSQVVKQYDYIYTGKNSEVLKFDIDFSINFSNVLAADDYKGSTDLELKNKQSQSNDPQAPIDPLKDGASVPSNVAGALGTSQNKSTATNTSFGVQGGGGVETPAHRAARIFHDAITNPNDMVILNMDIVGDPYWIVNSGVGNYTSKPVNGVKDLNMDGSVNWQNGEVDVLVNFRSPFDINQTTGLYDFKNSNLFDFGASTSASPTLAFTGLYRVNRVRSVFRDGHFTQTLMGSRRPLQESKKPGTANAVMSVDTPLQASDKAGFANGADGKGTQ